MNCMKCGREIPATQVFCNSCLEVMERYPVKPDTAIHLPHRREQQSAKKPTSRRRQLSPEEQVLQLKRLCRRLLFCLIVLILLLAAAVTGLILQLQDEPAPIPIGRNYTIDTTPQD